jgi:AAA+ superfamily predicted ATPase
LLRPRATGSTWLGEDYKPLTTLYALRLTVRAGGAYGTWNTQAVAELFDRLFGPAREGVEIELDELLGDTKPYTHPEKVALLSLALGELERSPPAPEGRLFDNARSLGTALALTKMQQLIVAFRVLARVDRLLGNVLEQLGNVPIAGAARVIATAFRAPVLDVETALAAGGRLARSGILHLSSGFGSFFDVVEPLDGLSRALLSQHDSLESLVSFAAQPSPAPQLALDDYPHLAEPLGLVLDYLRAFREDRQRGGNILLYGRPGVGKTELVRAIARTAGLRLREVLTQTGHDGALDADERCGYYQLQQSFFERAVDAAILFDEAEDVLGNEIARIEGRPARGKSWMLKALEENPVPAFWIVNSVRSVDPAVLRRFHMVIEVPQPPRAVRTSIVSEALEGLPVKPDVATQLAASEHLPPAVIAQAARVIRLARVGDGEAAARHLHRLTGSYLVAQGRVPPPAYPRTERYSLDLVNASEDLAALCTGLRVRGRGALLLHGPPGTGKTAFAHHLAETVNRPLETKRASDLLGPFIGQTEANLAKAFRSAATRNAVLFLDEADSFLARRENAFRSWEVQHVNELLTQMECFSGILLCATNFVDNLDRAALRRFGATIRFDCLKPAQAGALLCQTLEALGDVAPEASAAIRLVAGLDTLTAGDFTAARNRWEMLGRAPTAEMLAQTLRELCELKAERRARPIGFTA